MRNILLFGPPASGKLSVATAIAANGQHVVVDNHRTIDAANIINRNQRSQIPRLSEKLREWLYTATEVKVVATVVYAAGTDDALIDKYNKWLSRDGCPRLLVQLHCSREVAKDRCLSESRAGTSKIIDPVVIEKLYTEHDFDSKHPNDAVMHICSEDHSINEMADQIFKLAEQGAQPDAFGAG
jgi:shikimate kinase